MGTTIVSVPTITALSLSLPTAWCLNVVSDNASTARIIKEAEPAKKHWIKKISVVCLSAGTEWFKILDGTNEIVGPITIASGVPWTYEFVKEVHGTENAALKIKTKTDVPISAIIEGFTDAYTSFVYTPSPANGAENVGLNTDLAWDSPAFIVSHSVYMGTSPNSLNLLGSTPNKTYEPGTLTANTTYYWRVDASDGTVIPGTVWEFRTSAV